MKKLSFIVVLAILSVSGALFARKPASVEEQLRVADSGELQLLIRTDGALLFGRITKIVADHVYFETEGDTVIIFIPQIKEVKEITRDNIKNGKYWSPNPNVNRLYLFPTARPLKKGRGYVAGYYIIAPMAAYGLTERFSIAGGASFLNAAGAVFMAGAYLAPKFAVSIGDYVSLSAGAAGAQGCSQRDFDPTLLIAYGAGTFGKPGASLTFGAGYGVFRLSADSTVEFGEFTGALGFMAGGEIRMTRRIAIVTENYFMQGLWDFKPIVSYGMRFFGESFSLEGAFINTIGVEEFKGRFPGFPLVSIVYNF